MRSDTVIRFPVRKYKKLLKEQGKKLTKETFYRLVNLFNVHPPDDFLTRHHCGAMTAYQNNKQRTKFIHVLKV